MRTNSRFKQIIQSPKAVLVHFYADWCQPCHQLVPVLKEVRENFGINIRIIKVNVDDNPSIAAQFRVRNLPTLMLFRSGAVKWTGEGVPGASELARTLHSFL